MEYFFNFEKLAYVTGKKPEGCILCLIRDKSPDVVNLTVYETESFIVSINLYPFNPGHLMIFPRRHTVDIRDFTSSENNELSLLVNQTLSVLDRLYNPAGYNTGYNMGAAAGASIDHIHMHIIPRYPRELGIADLLAGRRVLVESPMDSSIRVRAAFADYSSS
ncbi:MAG: HIT domain-containing protein [Spirochaetaceae bacterium]|nr:MAG: HIT domain-containing protein [Spirochaetaceae bacterium]